MGLGELGKRKIIIIIIKEKKNQPKTKPSTFIQQSKEKCLSGDTELFIAKGRES